MSMWTNILATLRPERPAKRKTYVIDGLRFHSLEGFFAEVGRVLIPGAQWGNNLFTFNEILGGGFGTPEDGFILRWDNADISQQRLAYPETVRQLEKRLETCDANSAPAIERLLAEARQWRDATVFDWVVEIIRSHGAGGAFEQHRVELELKGLTGYGSAANAPQHLSAGNATRH